MSDSAGDINFLESIIKVEPEEFEITEQQATDDVLASKISAPDSLKSQRSSIEALARKGNEGLRFDKPHTCCICQKVISKYSHLLDHLKNMHCRITKFSCDLCPKFYFTKPFMRRHMRESHSAKKFTCNSCDFKTTVKRSLEVHKLTHSAKIECPICKKQVSSLKSHQRMHEPEESCLICQKMISKRYVRKHMKVHGLYECNICDEAFANFYVLRNHKLRRHYQGKLFECHCGSVYRDKYALLKHQGSHNSEKLTCNFCQKQFTRKFLLSIHCRRMHRAQSEERMNVLNSSGPFTCDKCGSVLVKRKTFRVHIAAHKSIKTFCDLCPRSFNHRRNLVDHMRRNHLKLRPFSCEICEFKGFAARDLRKHMLKHGQKTECNICHKLVGDMNRHLRTHARSKRST